MGKLLRIIAHLLRALPNTACSDWTTRSWLSQWSVPCSPCTRRSITAEPKLSWLWSCLSSGSGSGELIETTRVEGVIQGHVLPDKRMSLDVRSTGNRSLPPKEKIVHALCNWMSPISFSVCFYIKWGCKTLDF